MILFQSREDLENAQANNYRSNLRYLGNGVGDDWFALPQLSAQRESYVRYSLAG